MVEKQQFNGLIQVFVFISVINLDNCWYSNWRQLWVLWMVWGSAFPSTVLLLDVGQHSGLLWWRGCWQWQALAAGQLHYISLHIHWCQGGNFGNICPTFSYNFLWNTLDKVLFSRIKNSKFTRIKISKWKIMVAFNKGLNSPLVLHYFLFQAWKKALETCRDFFLNYLMFRYFLSDYSIVSLIFIVEYSYPELRDFELCLL